MNNLYLMTTIMNRKDAPSYTQLFKDNGLNVLFFSLGYGTATNEVLDYLGLDSSQKAVSYCVLTKDSWIQVKKQMERKLQIDAPGGGIAFIVPLSSICGRGSLNFLLGNDNYVKEEESTLKNTEHEQIIVIAEYGYSELVMNAAKSAGAYGGTILHAKGTGMEAAEKFMGVSLASEKEIIYIVTKTTQKNAIMKSIIEKAGPNTKAKAIAFSLPVTETAGLRLIED